MSSPDLLQMTVSKQSFFPLKNGLEHEIIMILRQSFISSENHLTIDLERREVTSSLLTKYIILETVIL